MGVISDQESECGVGVVVHIYNLSTREAEAGK
jgi:hypothetical protein